MTLQKELQAEWQRKKDATIKDEQTHTVTCRDFAAELAYLHHLTFDRRFLEIRDLISALNLTDGAGNWKKGVLPIDELPPRNSVAGVAELLKRGMSKRQAFATVAAKHFVEAKTFAGAVAKVKREWDRSERVRVGQMAGAEYP